MTQFAFVFPGQGSQAVGMLADMAATWPVIEETFGEASAALGYDLWALTQQGPAEELNKTCTIINSSGVIAGENKTLICYVNYFELQKVKEIISRNKGSFSTVSTIDEILR